ncbi:MAG: Stage IV sporulation protein [Candidatus Carbobacillus altaicus]|uniref:Stage IV sporulation protein n=1 Tax=Candidatus Carbonibacillus altaicus TaxID=2163959 RepID=A0A2R6Y314_9BACL|nr:MAG: Stage IV sporulation protein [Candidatus Carbobacillus altaicus]
MPFDMVLKTYLTVEARGAHLSRFLDQAAKQGIILSDIRLLEYDADKHLTAVRFRLEGESLKRLRLLRRETRTRLSIIEKKGGSVLFRQTMRRQGFMIGFFLFIFLLAMLSQLIWSVEVSGTTSLPVDQVKGVAAKLGLKTGAWKGKLPSVDRLEDELLKGLPEAAWVGVKIDGVVARITVLEKKRPDKPPLSSPQSLVAAKKAVIVDYFVRRGRPVVRPNMIVRPGDTLVSGILGVESNAPRRVSADGEVYGEVWYDVEVELPRERSIPLLTGTQGERFYLHLAGRSIPFWGKKAPAPEEGASYFTETDVQPVHIGTVKLPLVVVTEHWYEARPEVVRPSDEELKEEALALARESLKRKGRNVREIREEKILQERLEDDKVYIKVHYGVVENIAVPQVITDLPQNEQEKGKSKP